MPLIPFPSAAGNAHWEKKKAEFSRLRSCQDLVRVSHHDDRGENFGLSLVVMQSGCNRARLQAIDTS
jgi:hypothetical protein